MPASLPACLPARVLFPFRGPVNVADEWAGMTYVYLLCISRWKGAGGAGRRRWGVGFLFGDDDGWA